MMEDGQDRFRGLIDRLPKAELHLHLEGAVPWPLIRSWSPDPLPERPHWWDRDYRFSSFPEFISTLRSCWKPWLVSLDRVGVAASGIFAALVEQNVRYVELSFGLGAYDFPVAEVVTAIKQASPKGLHVRVIAGISRDLDLDWMHRLAREALDTEILDGIDLHGDESAGCLDDFVAVYEEARDKNMIAKAHAGEFRGPSAVREAVERLGVTRVEHGIASAGDADLVRFLRDRGVTLDVCPWSNVKLGATEALRGHPIEHLHEAGVAVTVNTDDPTAFGQTLTDEIEWLGSEVGMPEDDVIAVVRNGFTAADLTEPERAVCLKEVDLVTRGEERGEIDDRVDG
jgi:adenosine deaminase